MKLTNHAIAHWYITSIKASLRPNSFLIDDTAAIHGVYNKQKIIYDIALAFVKNKVILFAPIRTFIVDTTVSFAMNPDISDITDCQLPKPRGLKIGATNPDNIANSDLL